MNAGASYAFCVAPARAGHARALIDYTLGCVWRPPPPPRPSFPPFHPPTPNSTHMARRAVDAPIASGYWQLTRAARVRYACAGALMKGD